MNISMEQYNLFKDAPVNETIKRLKDIIISKLNINIREKILERNISNDLSIISVHLEYPELTEGVITAADGK